jgi:predicted nucleic acid-binding Zn ribbon protein
MKRKCMVCDETLRGRLDQKFCSDFCRSNFHNDRYRLDNFHVKKINRVLMKNRRILKSLASGGVQKIPVKVLMSQGFHFDYCTHVEQKSLPAAVKWVYDFGYKMDKANTCVLIQTIDSTFAKAEG